MGWDLSTEVQLPWKTRADGSVWTGTAEPRNSTGPSEQGRTAEAPTLARRKTSQRIRRITMAEAAGTMIAIDEAMMAADAEAVVGGPL